MFLQTKTKTAFRTAQRLASRHPQARLPFITPRSASILTRTMASSAAAKRLQDKTVLITGASSGIGRSCAFEFARTAPANGLRLILTARRVDSLRQIAADIEKETAGGVKVLPVKLDVSSPEEVRGLVPGLPAEWKEVDVLVNNAYVGSSSLVWALTDRL